MKNGSQQNRYNKDQKRDNKGQWVASATTNSRIPECPDHETELGDSNKRLRMRKLRKEAGLSRDASDEDVMAAAARNRQRNALGRTPEIGAALAAADSHRMEDDTLTRKEVLTRLIADGHDIQVAMAASVDL